MLITQVLHQNYEISCLISALINRDVKTFMSTFLMCVILFSSVFLVITDNLLAKPKNGLSFLKTHVVTDLLPEDMFGMVGGVCVLFPLLSDTRF